MCDLDRVSWLLITAKAAYLAVLIMLGVALLNSASLFAAAANVPLMVAVIASMALATSMYIWALVELDKCAADTCSDGLSDLRQNVVALLTLMGVLTGLVVGLALVAWIPFVGAANVGAVLGMFIGFSVGTGTVIELSFVNAANTYNNCRARAGVSTLIGWLITLLSVLIIIAAALFSAYGFFSGRIPLSVEW